MHVTILAELLKPHCPNVITLVGSESIKEKRQKMEQLHSIPSTEPLVIIATGKYVGEGFDYARLDTLFLVSPIAWKGRLQQYTGRLHREFEGKKDVQVYDYIDIRVPVCESMYRKRLKGYASIGYRIRNNEMFESLFPTADLIYDGQNFVQPFISDLTQCKRSIVISCPRVKIGRNTQIAERLIDLTANGIEIVLIQKKRTMILFVCYIKGCRLSQLTVFPYILLLSTRALYGMAASTSLVTTLLKTISLDSRMLR